jgi:hypothetical protein
LVKSDKETGMGKLQNLLRWKREVPIKDRKGEVVETVYMRIIGDADQQEAYRIARIESSKLRASLKDTTSERYLDQVEALNEANEEQCKAIIDVALDNTFTQEAFANVERPEEPRIAEIAVDPDAPTLEEQEKLDAAVEKADLDYRKAITEYVEQKKIELEARLSTLPIEELREEAKRETTSVLALGEFLQRSQDEKVWRGTYDDAKLKDRSFGGYEDFNQLDSFIKEQLREAYLELETDPETVKN